MKWTEIFLLLLIKVSPFLGQAIVTVDCGDKVLPGEAQLLTCKIQGSIKYGISWFRGNEEEPIVTCFPDRNCKSIDDTKFRITVNPHKSNLQQIQVNSINSGDFSVPWSCNDGHSKPDNFSESSTCRILQKKAGLTTATCGDARVGDSHIMRCTADEILNEIVWFRGHEIIIRCDTTGQCRPHSDADYVGLDSQILRIKHVSEDDIKQDWTCLDGDVLYDAPASSTCRMKRVYSTKITTHCGLQADVGKPLVLTCKITGNLVNGVTWFRGNKVVVRCNPELKCFPENSDYRESVPEDKSSVKLIIVELSKEDIHQTWTCIDDDKLPPYQISADSQCQIVNSANVSMFPRWFAMDMKTVVYCLVIVFFSN